jgi:squalene-hopene/tetraprenyl-beta-curcumene cyclase
MSAVAAEPTRPAEFPLREAIESTVSNLLGRQNLPFGHWCGELGADATLPSDLIMLDHFLGTVESGRERRLVRRILDLRTDDGGWAIFPGGQPDLSATVKAIFALRLAGLPADDKVIVRAGEIVRERGGLSRANSFSRYYLALFGLWPWGELPAVPPELTLIPRGLPFNIGEMSSWSRTIVVPLSIIWHQRPRAAAIPDWDLDELIVNGEESRPPAGVGPHVWPRLFGALDRGLHLHERLPWRPQRALALRVAHRWLLERLEDSEGLGAIFPAMVNSIIALRALGYSDHDPLVRRQIAHLHRFEIDDGRAIRVQPCFSAIWDTAISLVALRSAGLPPDEPRLRRAADWLLSQEIRRPGDWSNRVGDVEPSGWAFEHHNPHYPDVDDTAMVLIALSDIRATDGEWQRRVSDRAERWLLAMQSRHGGWGAFDRDNTRAILTQVPFADHNAMIDPPTPDITARVLEAFAARGHGLGNPAVSPAIAFLRRGQCDDGSWGGRWGVNHIYGTWQVLRGLRAIGVEPDDPMIRRGARWLRDVQNSDGGWGESCESYADPALRGVGESTPSQTAWALMGLMDGGPEFTDPVERGVQWLLTRRLPDGGWDEELFTGTGFPCVFYLEYTLYRLHFPIIALSEWRRVKER